MSWPDDAIAEQRERDLEICSYLRELADKIESGTWHLYQADARKSRVYLNATEFTIVFDMRES